MGLGVNKKMIPYRKVKLEFLISCYISLGSILIHLNLNQLSQKRHHNYVEIKCQLDATDDFYC